MGYFSRDIETLIVNWKSNGNSRNKNEMWYEREKISLTAKERNSALFSRSREMIPIKI